MQGEGPPDAANQPLSAATAFRVGRRQTVVERLGGAIGLGALLALAGASVGAGALLVQGGRTDGVLGGAAMLAGLVVAVAALAAIRRRLARAGAGVALVSTCPVCGYRSARTFGDAPTVCGACPAYLEARGLFVREVDEGSYRGSPDFALPLRVIDALPGGPRFPGTCVICGNPARHRRAIAFFDASALAAEAGTVKAANVVMLGAMASALPFKPDTMEAIIRRSVPPKTIDVNLKAFELGRSVGAEVGA